MVERSPYLTAFSHLIMVLGVIIVGFPLYWPSWPPPTPHRTSCRCPCPCCPARNFWQTYRDALFGGGAGVRAPPPPWPA